MKVATAKKSERTPRTPPCRLGQPMRWTPYAWTAERFPGAARDLCGTVVYVNAAHGYYTVEALHNGTPWRESFKY